MLKTMVDEPFGPPVASVPLRRSPLRLVIAQLRFPRVIALTDESYVGQLQELIRGTYSDLRKDAENQVILGPQGVQAQQSSEVWRFTDAKTGWEVSLAQEFVALSTHSYTSRDDFMVRLRAVLEAVQQVAQLQTAERFGVRYIDRISSEPLGRISELVRPEVLGPVSPHGAHGADLQHSLTDCQYALEGSRALRARWGLLPANSTFDPAVEPDSEVTWVLDLDAFVGRQNFELDAILRHARELTDVIYRYFRWATTRTFLEVFGADL